MVQSRFPGCPPALNSSDLAMTARRDTYDPQRMSARRHDWGQIGGYSFSAFPESNVADRRVEMLLSHRCFKNRARRS